MTGTIRLQLGAALAALALVGFFVVRTSQAAFTGQTSSTGNTFSAGTVSLDNDRGSSAMFNATDLGPGDSVTDCILVTYTGSLTPSQAVDVSSSSASAMAAHLDVAVEVGDVGATCTAFGTAAATVTGTLDALAGTTGWTPSGADGARAFRITVTVDPAIPDTFEGASLNDGTFTWTATAA